jgi:hypothetical protein
MLTNSTGLSPFEKIPVAELLKSFPIFQFCCMWKFYTTPCKKCQASNAISVCKAIRHFEIAVNHISVNLCGVNGNPEPSTKHA